MGFNHITLNELASGTIKTLVINVVYVDYGTYNVVEK
jgi:hypothetical protein